MHMVDQMYLYYGYVLVDTLDQMENSAGQLHLAASVSQDDQI